MLGPQPPRSAGKSAHTPHDDTESQPNSIAAATTQMMWSVALATTLASFASTAHGLALWSQMLRAPIIGPWSLDADALVHDAAATSGASTQETAATAAPAADSPGEEAAAFASYRSAGGHASTQVITHH
jgi:hypothetical protein